MKNSTVEGLIKIIQLAYKFKKERMFAHFCYINFILKCFSHHQPRDKHKAFSQSDSNRP